MRCDDVFDPEVDREDVRPDRVRERMDAVTKAGLLSAEALEMLGLKGQPGFMGVGSFGGSNRSAGYRTR